MTEEEKEAIECLKGMIQSGGTLDSGFERGEEKIFQTILNLIRKLQKENEDKYKGIERLKKKCEELRKQNIEKVSSFVFDRIKHNYIPKDKIREKIDTFFDNLIYAKDKNELKEALKEELLEEE